MKYLCVTSVSGLYERGEVYNLDGKNREVRMYVNLGYLEEVKKGPYIAVQKKKGDKK